MYTVPFKPLTKTDVAEILGVSIRTVENLVSQGRMPAPAHIGARVLWHPDVFYAWLDQTLRGGGWTDVTDRQPVMAQSSGTVQRRKVQAENAGPGTGRPSRRAALSAGQEMAFELDASSPSGSTLDARICRVEAPDAVDGRCRKARHPATVMSGVATGIPSVMDFV
jgi:excisionase family DNA binding protein